MISQTLTVLSLEPVARSVDVESKTIETMGALWTAYKTEKRNQKIITSILF